MLWKTRRWAVRSIGRSKIVRGSSPSQSVCRRVQKISLCETVITWRTQKSVEFTSFVRLHGFWLTRLVGFYKTFKRLLYRGLLMRIQLASNNILFASDQYALIDVMFACKTVDFVVGLSVRYRNWTYRFPVAETTFFFFKYSCCQFVICGALHVTEFLNFRAI